MIAAACNGGQSNHATLHWITAFFVVRIKRAERMITSSDDNVAIGRISYQMQWRQFSHVQHRDD
jgi:hypothetical protein